MTEQRRRTVLVTGASGFVGQPLVAALVANGYAVRAATRSRAIPTQGVETFLVGDFMQPIDWTAALRGVDVVVHAAALAHGDAPDIPAEHYDRVNHIATRELASAAARAGVAQFIFISSVRAQAGASADRVLRESDAPQPTDAYGASKLTAEAAVRAAGVPFTILRPVVIYGPNTKANFRLLVRLAAQPLPLPFGGFVNRRSILAIENLVSAILFAMTNPRTLGETFLVADPTPIALRDIFAALRRARGRKPGLVPVPTALFRAASRLVGRPDLWERIGGEMVVDTGKLASFGWHAPFDTERGLAMVIQNGA